VDGIVTEADWLLGAYADVNAGLSIIGFETGELPSLPPFRLFTKEWSDHYESAPPPTVPTSITRQPLSQTAKAGDTVTFSVDAAGSGTLTYQWYQNGEVLQGETAKDLTLRNVASGHTGSYYVRVNGSGGATNSSVATLSITAGGSTGPGSTYLVIDLSAGPSATSYPVSYLSSVPSGGWSDVYKTTKLVMRRIPAGTFTMGSPTSELGRYSDETQHQVTLTKDFYIGVFEVTQKQWERVMGTWPSYFNNTSYRDSRPVEQVSYYDIRENPANSAISPNWPASAQVHADSFMGKLRAKTGLTTLDLPTESQWERACRAGTGTALNSGYNLTSTSSDPRMSEVGRYWYNGGSGYTQNGNTSVATAKVGSYLPNAWGLYDMHGNVWEWCLDWYGTYPGTVADPAGAASGSCRVERGGGWGGGAWGCRSANRISDWPDYRIIGIGFRLSRTLP